MKRTILARGFTLIELLVVIAIIGILSSVVLGALNVAREKGKDAAVKADMNSISSQAAIYSDTNSGYGTSVNDCSAALYSDPTIQAALSGIDTANNGGAKACYAADTTYAVGVARPSGNGFTPDTVYWCADSTGQKCGIADLAAISSGSCGCP